MWIAIKNFVRSWLEKLLSAIVLIAVVYGGFTAYSWYDKANNHVKVAGTIESASSLCHLRKTEIKGVGEIETSTTEKVACDVARSLLENDPSYDGFVIITTTTFLINYKHEGVEHTSSLTTTRDTDQSVGEQIDILVEIANPSQITWP